MRTHKELIKFEVDIPDGYQAIDYRAPRVGEQFIDCCGQVANSFIDWSHESRYVIVKKL